MFVFDDLIMRDPKKDAATVAERLAYFHNKTPVRGPLPLEQENSAEPWPNESAIPEIGAADFHIHNLRSAMACKGCLIVRNYVEERSVAALKTTIDCAQKGLVSITSSQFDEVEDADLFTNPPCNLSVFLPEPKLTRARRFYRSIGSTMVVESASTTEALIEWFSRLNLRDLLEGYLGERACLSALKWTFQKVDQPIVKNGWHQNCTFMGKKINSLAMWMPLDLCGGSSQAPGIDIVPVRFHESIGAGDDDALFNWSTSSSSIKGFKGNQAPVSPVFYPGDIFLFDHMLLQRTQFKEVLKKQRYAVETWFFGEENFPSNQIPMKW